MSRLKRTSLPAAILCLAGLSSAYATPSAITSTIDLSAEASRPAVNDVVRASVSAEETGTTPGELAAKVNKQIDAALKTIKGYPAVKSQSGNTSTYPVYGKNNKIDAWRMRSELMLESKDLAAFSELLGKLQMSLSVSNLMLQPAVETRKKAEDEAILEALTAFKARAKLIADSFGRPYRIKQVSVNVAGQFMPPMRPMMAKAMIAGDAAPMPVEAGESAVSVTVTGQVELE